MFSENFLTKENIKWMLLCVLLSFLIVSLSYLSYGFTSGGAILVYLLHIIFLIFFIAVTPLDDWVLVIFCKKLILLTPALIFSFLYCLFSKVEFSIIINCSLILFSFYVFVCGLQFFSQKILNQFVSQLLCLSIVVFIFSFIVVSPEFLVNNFDYDTQSKIYKILSNINPLIVVADVFGIDVFHANQLYQVFGSNFIVKSSDLSTYLKLYILLTLLFWVLGALINSDDKKKEEIVS